MYKNIMSSWEVKNMLCIFALSFLFQLVGSISNCTNVMIHDLEGYITSPNYPDKYPDHTSCSWHINIPKHSVLSIRLMDLNIEANDPHECGLEVQSSDNHCCIKNWLSVPLPTHPATKQLVCGKKQELTYEELPDTLKVATFKFHSTKNRKGRRGFKLKYTILPIHVSCSGSEFGCSDGQQCIAGSSRCNGIKDCKDGSDEISCSHDPSFTCSTHGLSPCPNAPNVCYNASSGACASQLTCPGVEGQQGEKWVPCQDDGACVLSNQICDKKVDCADRSDEAECDSPPDVFFMCDNWRWIRSYQVCDGADDCGDHSDEDGCVTPALETAIILGCLSCSLLFIVLASYVFQHNSRRAPPPPPSRPHFLLPFREPPPPYPMDPPPGRRRHRRHRRHANRSSNSPPVQPTPALSVPLSEELESPSQRDPLPTPVPNTTPSDASKSSEEEDS